MKKMFFLLMVFMLLVPFTAATAIGRAIPDTNPTAEPTATPEPAAIVELSQWLGLPADACRTALQEQGISPYSGLKLQETDGMLSSISVHEGSFSVFGLAMGDDFDAEKLLAAGWEQRSRWYENDTLDYTFQMAVGSAQYTFRLWHNLDTSSITYLSLKVDNPAAHLDNVAGGRQFLIVP